MEDVKINIAKAIVQSLPDANVSQERIYELLEQPKQLDHGDVSLPCFIFAKELKKSPGEIAQSLQTALSVNEIKGVSDVQVAGPYVNFHFDKARQNKQLIKKILDEQDRFGLFTQEQPQKIAVEYPGPNTNKPLHLGHARLMILGRSLVHLLKQSGHDVVTVNINNDRGIHICKSMLAYKLFGNNEEPTKKSDHYVGDWYVRYAQEVAKDPSLDQQAQQMLVQWEQKDPEVLALWHKMRQWCLDGFKESYATFGVQIDKDYFESDIYEQAREIVKEGVEKGVFTRREDGAIMANFDDKLPEKVVLRSDGTTIYITQDIYLAQLRYEDFTMDSCVYMVGNEQNLHFKQLFAILKQLDMPFADKLEHFSTGMISLPTGKMKSREGVVVDADNLLEDLQNMAVQETQNRDSSLSEEEVQRRGKIIGEGALRFYILKYAPASDFVFDPKQSISFEGETGPYVMYTYARIQSVLRKQPNIDAADYAQLVDDHEKQLVKTLSDYTHVVRDATNKHQPYLIAHYLIKLTKDYNSFYHACPMLQAEESLRDARVALSKATGQVIKNALHLLNIQTLEEM